MSRVGVCNTRKRLAIMLSLSIALVGDILRETLIKVGLMATAKRKSPILVPGYLCLLSKKAFKEYYLPPIRWKAEQQNQNQWKRNRMKWRISRLVTSPFRALKENELRHITLHSITKPPFNLSNWIDQNQNGQTQYRISLSNRDKVRRKEVTDFKWSSVLVGKCQARLFNLNPSYTMKGERWKAFVCLIMPPLAQRSHLSREGILGQNNIAFAMMEKMFYGMLSRVSQKDFPNNNYNL